MKIYIKSSSAILNPIEVDSKWMYKPFDSASQIYENPIEYAGDELAEEVVDAAHSFRYEAVAEDIEDVDLDELKSVQAFVTKEGLRSSKESNKDVWAVRYEGNLYLMDGNHRVARAKMKGDKYYKMLVSTLEEV